MKPQRPNRQTRSAKTKDSVKPNCDQAIRKCEEAAARIHSASNELAACWTALGIEIATGATTTELLRRRAWCNVLELRLKEKAHALEQARHDMDASWNEVMLASKNRDLQKRFNPKPTELNIFDKSWSLLLQPKSPPTTRAKTLAAAK